MFLSWSLFDHWAMGRCRLQGRSSMLPPSLRESSSTTIVSTRVPSILTSEYIRPKGQSRRGERPLQGNVWLGTCWERIYILNRSPGHSIQHDFEFEFEKILIIFHYNPTNKLNPYRQNNPPPDFSDIWLPKTVNLIAMALPVLFWGRPLSLKKKKKNWKRRPGGWVPSHNSPFFPSAPFLTS